MARRLGTRALAFAACLALAACAKVAGPGSGGAGGRANAFTHPHVLRFGDLSELSTLNPLLSQELQLSLLSQLTMAWLVRYDAHNNATPELATEVPTLANHGISADGKTVTFHLRRGVKWSDGVPFTARDVRFTVGLILDPKTNVTSRNGYDDIAKMETPNSYTIAFHLKKPFSPFSYATFAPAVGPAILPEHLLVHSTNINQDPYNTKPVGIGPFRYVEWKRGDRVVLERNPYYWRGAAKLDRVEYHVIPNRDTLVTQLQTGQLDLWALSPRKYYPRLQALTGFHVVRQPSFLFGHMDFNLARPVLAELAVRQALRLATDRRLLRDKIYNGIGILQDGIVSPASPFFDPKIPFAAYDPARANALLDGAGWRRGADGIRVKNGRRLELVVATNSGSPDTDTQIENIRTMWKAVGAAIALKEYAPSVLFAQYQDGGIINTGKWDVVLFAWSITASPDVNSIYGCREFPPAGQNANHWCDPRAEAAMQRILSSNDVAEQKRANAVLQERIAQDVPTVVQAVYEDLYTENADLKNFHPNQATPFDDMMQVDI